MVAGGQWGAATDAEMIAGAGMPEPMKRLAPKNQGHTTAVLTDAALAVTG